MSGDDVDLVTNSDEDKIVELQQNTTYETVTICGSMRFHNEMLLAAERLTLDGAIVLLPLVRKDSAMSAQELKRQELHVAALEDQGVDLAVFLDAMHREKIDRADRIVVVTNRARYIGDSTKAEIAYAVMQCKSITFDLYSVPTER